MYEFNFFFYLLYNWSFQVINLLIPSSHVIKHLINVDLLSNITCITVNITKTYLIIHFRNFLWSLHKKYTIQVLNLISSSHVIRHLINVDLLSNISSSSDRRINQRSDWWNPSVGTFQIAESSIEGSLPTAVWKKKHSNQTYS